MARAKLYELTDEHRAQLGPWRDRWIANAMSTAAMSDEDRQATVDALRGMYAAAGLPWHGRVVFVPSTFVMRFSGGFAAAIWHLRTSGQAEGESATWAATMAATESATKSATESATKSATMDATGAAERSEWWDFPLEAMVAIDRALGLAGLGLRCADYAWRMWQGGNQWPGYDSFLSFFRHVARLGLDYTRWEHWESASMHGGPRIVHSEFCMVSDRPEVLLVDDRHRPHCDTGPFCRWRDGTALYSVHGVRIPAWVIKQPARLTVAAIDAETNAEVRRVMIERFGMARFLREGGAKLLHEDRDTHGNARKLWRREVAGDEPIVMLELINSTPEPDGHLKTYAFRVPPTMQRVLQALAWQWDVPEETYAAVEVET